MSNDKEKKFSLDELPDAGSEPAPKEAPKKKPAKEAVEPRVERLQNLHHHQKVEMMVQKWAFDEPIRNYFWVWYIMFLVVLEFTPFYRTYMTEVQSMGKTSATMGQLWVENAGIIEILARHPIILLLLLPLVYRGAKASEYVFTVSFDGIDTVKKVLPPDSKELVSRVFIKWKEIERVEKGRVGEQEVLRLYSPEGQIADLIWYIDASKKKAILLLLKGMIIPKHPLRVFLENEKELK